MSNERPRVTIVHTWQMSVFALNDSPYTSDVGFSFLYHDFFLMQ